MRAMSRGLLLLILAVLAVLPASAADHAWLVGRWELTHAPDGDPKDWIEFTPDGQTVSISPNGWRTPDAYSVTEREVRAVYGFQGRETRTTSTYEKVQ